MRGEVHILVHCPIDTLQWGSTHSALSEQQNLDKYELIKAIDHLLNNDRQTSYFKIEAIPLLMVQVC